MLNDQPVEKVLRTYDGTIDVHSIFYTIQGEGPFAGRPAVFLRLAGCNLQCPWCDTEYTQGRRQFDIPTIMTLILLEHAHLKKPLVVITGGEPFRQQIGELLVRLVNAGYVVQVETNGTVAPPELHSFAEYFLRPQVNIPGVYIVCSPKTGKVHPAISARACCYKYVLDANNVSLEDGLPLTALGHVANPCLARPPEKWDLPIYIQPADHKDHEINQRNTEAAVNSAMTFGYTLQIQIHKIAGVP